MADLTQKYFGTGLSQAEGAELEALLDASPEHALSFSDRALAEYQAMGLPEPRLRGLSPGRFRLPLALLVSAGAAWAFWPSSVIKRPDLSLEGGSFSTIRHVAPAADDESMPPEKAMEAAPRFSQAPKFAAMQATQQGSRLGVVVKQQLPGPARVSVHDASGRELRVLFEGRLEPGKRRFEWDGRLPDGSAASPGSYSIEVRRGATLQTQQLKIRHVGQ